MLLRGCQVVQDKGYFRSSTAEPPCLGCNQCDTSLMSHRILTGLSKFQVIKTRRQQNIDGFATIYHMIIKQ